MVDSLVGTNGILVEIKAIRLSDHAPATFRFGTDGYNDPSGPGYFDPRLTQPLLFRRDMFSGGTTGGPNRISFGEIVLANDDGELDTIRQYSLIDVTMLIGDLSLPYNYMVPLIRARVLQALFSFRDLTLQMRDRLSDFAQPLQVNKYLGTNVLPDGVEGVAENDIKDKPKPLLFGKVLNITPILVNTSKLIYQVNDGRTDYIANVADNGAVLTQDASYIDLADMMANAPPAGHWRPYTLGGYFRIGALPQGTITCDAGDRATIEENTAARVALRIAARPPETGQVGISDGDVYWPDVDRLNAANDATVGIWAPDEQTYASLLDPILGSIGAWYGFDAMGMLRMARLDLPVAPSVAGFKVFTVGSDAALNEYDIIDLRFMPTADPDRGMPCYEVTLDYARNWTVQAGSALAGVVSQERRAFLKLAVRTATATDLGIKVPYPNSAQRKLGGLLVEAADATEEVNRQLTVFKTARDFVEIDTPLDANLIALIEIGSVVTVTIPRFDYNNGRLMRIIGIQYDALRRVMTIGLWG